MLQTDGHRFSDIADIAAGTLRCRADEACNAAHRIRSTSISDKTLNIDSVRKQQ
jgi:hypothetical protein